MSLNAFFKQNAEQIENVEYVVSNRFKNEKGEPEKWILRVLSYDEEKDIKKICTRQFTNKGRFDVDFDTEKYILESTTVCVVYPNLNDAELQDSYGVKSASDLLGKMLKPGELVNLNMKTQEINGYDSSDKGADIKN